MYLYNMLTRFLVFIVLLGWIEMNAQFVKNFDIEVSHGWMKNYNKGSIQSGSNSSAVEPDFVTILNEGHLWTNKLSISLGYNISKRHSVRIGYNRGFVGSSLTGTLSSSGFGGSGRFPIALVGSPNKIRYKSLGLHYSIQLPLDGDYFLFEIGASHQKNSFDDTIIFSHGLFVTNYNMQVSFGFRHCVTDNFDIISKVTVVNSFSNNEEYTINRKSTFVPFQIGLEIGLRFRV
ncbi:MAG: hypothetical protein ACI9P5_002025 [Saprospiraceae bacterium]|jgi:hypothetical protein